MAAGSVSPKTEILRIRSGPALFLIEVMLYQTILQKNIKLVFKLA
jgi:hypothetical protein